LQLKENCGSKENCDLFSSTAVEVVLADPKNLYQREIKSAAHNGKPISAHQNGYVTQSSQGSGARAFASVPRSVDDPAATGGGSIGYNQNLRLNQW
jgi:hypothetical protein